MRVNKALNQQIYNQCKKIFDFPDNPYSMNSEDYFVTFVPHTLMLVRP